MAKFMRQSLTVSATFSCPCMLSSAMGRQNTLSHPIPGPSPSGRRVWVQVPRCAPPRTERIWTNMPPEPQAGSRMRPW